MATPAWRRSCVTVGAGPEFGPRGLLLPPVLPGLPLQPWDGGELQLSSRSGGGKCACCACGCIGGATLWHCSWAAIPVPYDGEPTADGAPTTSAADSNAWGRGMGAVGRCGTGGASTADGQSKHAVPSLSPAPAAVRAERCRLGPLAYRLMHPAEPRLLTGSAVPLARTRAAGRWAAVVWRSMAKMWTAAWRNHTRDGVGDVCLAEEARCAAASLCEPPLPLDVLCGKHTCTHSHGAWEPHARDRRRQESLIARSPLTAAVNRMYKYALRSRSVSWLVQKVRTLPSFLLAVLPGCSPAKGWIQAEPGSTAAAVCI